MNSANQWPQAEKHMIEKEALKVIEQWWSRSSTLYYGVAIATCNGEMKMKETHIDY
jgi:hypothetical protein